MNQIHEKDWAEDDWGWHSGMDSCLYDGGEADNADDAENVNDENKKLKPANH